MRPIDGDKLIEWLDASLEDCINCKKNAIQMITASNIDSFKRFIAEQPTIEPYGTWIPCRERLPEYGRYFKVWASFSNQYASYTKRIHWDYDRFVWNNGREVKEMPDAWMPYFSPLPYREEKKDGDGVCTPSEV